MPRIRNVSPYGDLDVPLLGRVVQAGEEFDVDDGTAAVLLDQAENYAEVRTEQVTTTEDVTE